MIARTLVALSLVALAGERSPHASTTGKAPERIVSVGSSVTETLLALGLRDRIVSVDLASQYLDGMSSLPSVGYHRTLAAEGVLSLRPDLVLLTTEAGPPPVIDQLRAARIPVVVVDDVQTRDGAFAKLRAIARAVGKESAIEPIVDENVRALDALSVKNKTKGPKALFVYARGNGALMVSGTKTAADGILALAHVENTVTGYEGYRPLSAEAMIAAAPDVIVVPERALPIIGGADGLLRAPGVASTPAGRARRIVAVDDILMLGFGPRVGEAATKLSAQVRAAAPQGVDGR